jgi:hypothetical protein
MNPKYDLIRIELDDDAESHLVKFRDRSELERISDQRLGPLWARAFENALKVAGILAVGCAAEKGINALFRPRISLDLAKWATKFVEYCIRRTVYLGKEEIADNQSERAVNKIKNYIYGMVHDWERTCAQRDQKYKDKNRDGLVALSQITKRFQNMPAMTRKDAIQTLVDSNEISPTHKPGDETTWYEAVN